MKKLLMILGVVGSGIFVSGQAPPTQPRLTAKRIETFSDAVHFSGTIRIEAGNVVVTADEADGLVPAPGSPIELDLRGNVHVKVTPNR